MHDPRAPPGSVMLTPTAGFCLKAQRERWIEAGGKVFINVCSHARIDPVCGANLAPVTTEHLDAWGLANARVPVLVGPSRAMVDAEGRDATAVDAIFHPDVVERALRGGKGVAAAHYRDYLVDIAVKNVEEDHGIKVIRRRWSVLENARYKGPNGECSEKTHAFPVFAGDGGGGGDDDAAAAGGGRDASSSETTTTTAAPATTKREPSGRRRYGAAVIKKGFLTGSSGAGAELYPDGSAEGIPKPGEQYDPLGHIPESVRSKCHVVDTGAITGEDFRAVTNEYAATGRLDTAKRGVYAKGSEPGSGLREIGTGHPSRVRGVAAAKTKAPSKTPPAARTEPAHVVAETTLGGELAIEVRVQLPMLKGGLDAVDLDVGADVLALRSEEYDLKLKLPRAARAEDAKAKFSSKRMELKVTIPTT